MISPEKANVDHTTSKTNLEFSLALFRRLAVAPQAMLGYSRPATGSQTQGEALVVRMGHRLWGGYRCPIRGTQRRDSHRHLPTPSTADGREWRPPPCLRIDAPAASARSWVSHRHLLRIRAALWL